MMLVNRELRGKSPASTTAFVVASVLLSSLVVHVPVVQAEPLPYLPKDALPNNKYCGKQAVTLWECPLGKDTLVLCASQVKKAPGVLSVHRILASGTNRELVSSAQPDVKVHLENEMNGDASLAFTQGKREWTLIDPLRGPSIYEYGDGRSTQRQECGAPNQTLSLNYTVALIKQLEASRSVKNK